MIQPSWVVDDLVEILGFDEETVRQAILPELESQSHQVRLKSHLQDFLGPSPKAKSFIDRYLAYRFPSFLTASASTSTSTSGGHNTPNAGVGSDLKSAAGKKRVVDDSSFPRFAAPHPSSRPGSGHGSSSGRGTGTLTSGGGAYTPAVRGSRPGGGLTIHEARTKRLDGDPKGKGKGGGSGGAGEKIWDVPKGKQVKKLEGIRERLLEVQSGLGKMSLEAGIVPDCFCQARNHPLSTYTPHCPHCGLILCNLHQPHLPCTSCSSPLYSPAQLARLILRLSNEMDEQMAKEQGEREELERERKERLLAESGGGVFPTLPNAPTPGSGQGGNGGQSRKVLTIGKGKGKNKAMLTTTTYQPSPIASPRSTSPAPPVDIIPRPRSQPLDPTRIEKELNKMLTWRNENDRPWGDMKRDIKGEVWGYVEIPMSNTVEEGHQGRRKMAKKKKSERGRGGVDGRLVPGA